MRSEFPAPLSRLDVVLWFLRVQLWLSVLLLVNGLLAPYGFFVGVGLQNLLSFGLPILIFAVFPRVLASAMLSQSAREELSSLQDLRPLVGRCVGITLFVGSLGRAILLGFAIVEQLFYRRSLGFSPGYSGLIAPQIIATAFAFFLGFALAFGPAIRDGLRSR